MSENTFKIFYNGEYTDYKNKSSISVNDIDGDLIKNVYSFDTNGDSHISLIPGVLRLSAKNFNTTNSKGYISKRFDPIFNMIPSFMVKTNKIKDTTDKYVIVRIVIQTDKLTKKSLVSGSIEKYIGDVGDPDIEKDIGLLFAISHWTCKIDKLSVTSDIGITLTDLTPNRLDVTNSAFVKETDNSNRIFTVSVDPFGSKDIDDAISIQKLSITSTPWTSNGTVNDESYILGVHIADPTSYIIENSIIDNEISIRTESVYSMNKTKHMFPEFLSTDVFSLISDQPKRAFTVYFRLIKDNDIWVIRDHCIHKTLIKVNFNTTYDQFQSFVESSTIDEYSEPIKKMYEICKDLFHTYLNHSIVTYDSKKMIETMMILANSFVARFMVEASNKSTVPIILRSQKVTSYDLPTNSSVISSELLTKHIHLKAKSAILKIYNPDSDNSHSSLGLDLYTHFTSPIRRYSDILVHRVLYNLIVNENFELHKLSNHENMVHQMFMMNHYKKFYKSCYQFEQNIKIAQIVSEYSNCLPIYNVLNLSGTIIDISFRYVFNKNKLHDIKCILKISDPEIKQIYPNNCNKDTKQKLNKLYSSLLPYISNSMHTIHVTSMNDPVNLENANTDDFNDNIAPELESESDSENLDAFKKYINDKFTLFSKIDYKMCVVPTDVKKVCMYL